MRRRHVFLDAGRSPSVRIRRTTNTRPGVEISFRAYIFRKPGREILVLRIVVSTIDSRYAACGTQTIVFTGPVGTENGRFWRVAARGGLNKQPFGWSDFHRVEDHRLGHSRSGGGGVAGRGQSDGGSARATVELHCDRAWPIPANTHGPCRGLVRSLAQITREHVSSGPVAGHSFGGGCRVRKWSAGYQALPGWTADCWKTLGSWETGGCSRAHSKADRHLPQTPNPAARDSLVNRASQALRGAAELETTLRTEFSSRPKMGCLC